MATGITVSPDRLRWVVRRAGKSEAEAVAAFPPLGAWLDGAKLPTIAQLQKFAAKFHAPFGHLFLTKPPEERIPIPMFRGNDELTEWLNANAPKVFFIPLDADVMFSYQKALDWANSINNFSERAKADFSEVADSFIVATAAAKGMTLVTNEKSNLMSKRRVMIPDACAALGVRYCDLNTVFRELGVRV